MREFKFRAWDKVLNKMFVDVQSLYDCLGLTTTDERIYPSGNCDSFGDLLENENIIILQFTEIHDSKDNPIYEDHLVSDDQGLIWRIVFSYGAWVMLRGPRWRYLSNTHCTVVGNWYQHKDLYTKMTIKKEKNNGTASGHSKKEL